MQILAVVLWVGIGCFFIFTPLGKNVVYRLGHRMPMAMRRSLAPIGLALAAIIAVLSFVILGQSFTHTNRGLNAVGWIIALIAGSVFVGIETVTALVTLQSLEPNKETLPPSSASKRNIDEL